MHSGATPAVDPAEEEEDKERDAPRSRRVVAIVGSPPSHLRLSTTSTATTSTSSTSNHSVSSAPSSPSFSSGGGSGGTANSTDSCLAKRPSSLVLLEQELHSLLLDSSLGDTHIAADLPATVTVQPRLHLNLSSSSPPSPPILPPRSPLRRTARRPTNTKDSEESTPPLVIFNKPSPHIAWHQLSQIIEHDNMTPSSGPSSFSYLNRSLPSLSLILESLNPAQPHHSKSHPALGGAVVQEDTGGGTYYESSGPSSAASSEAMTSNQPTTTTTTTTTIMSKRDHALHELLSSERNYASDLALIRDVHIPLALGETLNLPVPLLTSTSTTINPSRTHSTASDSSASSLSSLPSLPPLPPNAGPPMTVEDTKIIFNNVPELAVLADQLSEQLEEALGSVLDGGVGEDRVGALFLRIIPSIEGPYKHYITRHSNALTHLSSLPQTPTLTAYLTQTQSVASALSHAWDIQSLLIKPVQRLLKYSLLLSAILDETPDGHGDKENLRKAKVRMDEVARSVNEGRRRWEVVKGVLAQHKSFSSLGSTQSPGGPGGSGGGKGLNVGTAASVNLTKIKSNIKIPPAVLAGKGNEETLLVQAMEADVKRMAQFTLEFAKSVVEWTRVTHAAVAGLRAWAIAFGRVLGLWTTTTSTAGDGNNSEAFDAFVELVEAHLMPLSAALESDIRDRLLIQLARLRNTKDAPLKLIAAMKEEEPAHYHLLTMNVSPKNRPAPGLLESSQKYLALRGQLALELPVYLNAMHRGIAACILHLARVQAGFWEGCKESWAELWDALRVEGEMNAGATETVQVWWRRWEEVEEMVRDLGVVNPPPVGGGISRNSREGTVQYHQYHQPPVSPPNCLQTQHYLPPPSTRNWTESAGAVATLASLESATKFKKDVSKTPAKGAATTVTAMLSSLGPTSPGQSPTSTKSTKGRGRGNSDASSGGRHSYGGASSSGGASVKRRSSESFAIAPLPPVQAIVASHSSSSSSAHQHNYSLAPIPRDPMPLSYPRPDSFESYVDLGDGYDPVGGGTIPSVAQGSSAVGASSSLESAAVRQTRPGHARSSSAANARVMMGSIGEEYGRWRDDGDEYDEYGRLVSSASTTLTTMPRGRTSKTGSGGKSTKAIPIRTSTSSGGLGTGYTSISAATTTTTTTTSRSRSSTRRPTSDLQRSSSSRSDAKAGKREHHHHSYPQGYTYSDSAGDAFEASSSSLKGSALHSSHSQSRLGRRTPSPHHIHLSSTPPRPPLPAPPQSQPRPYSWHTYIHASAQYRCQVIHPCKPPKDISYQHMPFFQLKVGKVFEVLYEAGHPSLHEDLPLHVDDGEDCLLLVRSARGDLGWALASFLVPLD